MYVRVYVSAIMLHEVYRTRAYTIYYIPSLCVTYYCNVPRVYFVLYCAETYTNAPKDQAPVYWIKQGSVENVRRKRTIKKNQR